MVRFLNFVKKISPILFKWSLIIFLICLAMLSSMVDTNLNFDKNIQINQKSSNFYSTSYKKAIKKSRESAVRVVSIDMIGGGVSTFSGTYISSYGGYFVITVAHGLIGGCSDTKIVYDQGVHDCLKIINIDSDNDYAIIQVDKIYDRQPIIIPRDLPKRNQWVGVYSLLNKVVYSGYPNSIGPLTISGSVAGALGNRFIYLHSYAWSGSSGSGVFDSKGKYIGHVVAIDVGDSEFGVQILNNIVLIVPAFKIDWTKTITEAE